MTNYAKTLLVLLAFGYIVLGEINQYESKSNSAKFYCTNGNSIDLTNFCNGADNCGDGSDELLNICSHFSCSSDEFRCAYGACISKHFRCDAIRHCFDGSDELGCSTTPNCSKSFFCNDGCIPFDRVCDGTADCQDKSDELPVLCRRNPCNSSIEYYCRSGSCISKDQICDGYRDCVDGSDENNEICNQTSTVITCPPVATSFATINCFSEDSLVDCTNQLPVGSIVRFECENFYKPLYQSDSGYYDIICQQDGTWNRPLLHCIPDCGQSLTGTPLIMNGYEIPELKWPWYATIYVKKNHVFEVVCGGTLISEKTVITAGHCIWKMLPEVMGIGLGKHYREPKSSQDEDGKIFEVRKVIMYPLYQDRANYFESDIALIILKANVQFSEAMKPICLDTSVPLDLGSTLIVAGMGLTENGTVSDQILETTAQVTSHKECMANVPADFRKYLSFSAFCGGWLNGSSVCNGDSGGGAYFYDEINGRWVLKGIISLSPASRKTFKCTFEYYKLFARVDLYYHWITDILRDL